MQSKHKVKERYYDNKLQAKYAINGNMKYAAQKYGIPVTTWRCCTGQRLSDHNLS